MAFTIYANGINYPMFVMSSDGRLGFGGGVNGYSNPGDIQFNGNGAAASFSSSSAIDLPGGRGYLVFDNSSPYYRAETKFYVNSSNMAIENQSGYLALRNTTPTGYIRFDTNNVEKMRLDSNGNVGIGITAPTAKLHIVGSADTQQLIVKANATQTTNLAEFQTSAAAVKFSVDVSGNIVAVGDVKGATYHVGATAGVDGTFTTVDLKTVTVTKGIITSIV